VVNLICGFGRKRNSFASRTIVVANLRNLKQLREKKDNTDTSNKQCSHFISRKISRIFAATLGSASTFLSSRKSSTISQSGTRRSKKEAVQLNRKLS
jgi:hypothetical protein